MPKALTIEKIEGKPGKVYYPLKVIEQPEPTPKDNEVVIKVIAAALNHRDLFIRQALYGAIGFGVPLLADGCGTVVKTGSSAEAKKWQGKRVIINPGQGWKDDPDGPESSKGYAILGGTKLNPLGTAQEMICIDAGEIEEAPKHLTANEAAALPLAGLTAWRATMTKSGNAKPGRNILVTGIGGGVAVMSLLYAVAAGANVYVSSGSQEKIDKAISLGAKGGINYKEKDWDKKLKELLPNDRKKLDAIIDGAGGDVAQKGAKLLRDGGIIAQYGMTVGPKMDWIMPDVLKNIELRGSTMGSRKEFADLVAFVNAKGLKPLVSRSVQGIDNLKDINSLFDDMNKGSQLGKLVIEISPEDAKSKL
ncbi:Zinc-type alcohol dehydrogenase-like protein YogA [Pseudocercospora fuligena]|uniref:Zinc-type alcohol dehydrogenase-like protein YogA n=1 Tax=Pseudocercospora fuligena TaxID=685502 RepID=A0A8H6RP27_9PEZI|nr:Zinc-type alcohol dehydrogenase-like protein YogA [Pseudocercospora fuligena]